MSTSPTINRKKIIFNYIKCMQLCSPTGSGVREMELDNGKWCMQATATTHSLVFGSLATASYIINGNKQEEQNL